MSGLDVGIILAALFGAFLGLQIGAVSAFFNIAGGIAGSWAASRFFLWGADLLGVSPSGSYMVIFVATAGVFVGTGILLSHLLRVFFLGLIDKFFGALLGIALVLVFVTAGVMPFLLEQTSSAQDLFRRSAFGPYLVRVTQKYFRVAPAKLWEKVSPVLESANVRRVRILLERSR